MSGSARGRRRSERVILTIRGRSSTRPPAPLVESLVLTLMGGIAGLVLAVWPVRLLNADFAVRGPAGAPAFLDLRLDGLVLAFTAAITMLTVVVFGLLPALRATRVALVSALKDASSLPGRA